ncbi:adenylate/guanylate cyclase domain-containing protein [Nitratireductor sp. XY-223]|uniref:adenylate/guanylate cyclase domain-containing protein n=1 Tax=Nitratireductor sp. XY-223 TaxID=2561926 RepID=UPI0010A9C448|nr:adenylate/guanylate cyclase domain-containing protein [Nitratireductor sp. XY-223]
MTKHGGPNAKAINDWLVSDGRLSGDGVAIVGGFAERLISAGVPLWRARVAQQFSNPLLSAWGVIWTREEARLYTVKRTVLSTDAWHGSPFEHVISNRTTLHKPLVDLDPRRDHGVYLELAQAGGTDFYAMTLSYGDGSVQGCSFATDSDHGFSQEDLDLIFACRHALACAMEPVAMRRSSVSLLRTYLGDGPADAVTGGTIRRGEHTHIEAVIMFCDLRGFTTMSAQWPEAELMEALDGYFELVVDAVREHGGEVLKFIGDGVLSVFPVADTASRATRCIDAVAAAKKMAASLEELNRDRQRRKLEPLRIGTGINIGHVTHGNIGSPDRLDFTVLGQAVNLASRVQDLCKVVGEPVLATASVAALAPGAFRSQGSHSVRGLDAPVEIHSLE